MHRSRTTEGGRRKEWRLSFARPSGAPPLVEQGESWGALMASRVGLGFGVLRSHTGREMLLGGPSLREAKQALQGLIPGRTHTAGPREIVLGKGLLTITISPVLAGGNHHRGNHPCPVYTAPPRPSPRTSTQAALALRWAQLPAAAPVWDTSTPPRQVMGGTSV